MSFKVQNTEKITIKRKGTVITVKDNNPIPRNPVGRKGKCKSNTNFSDKKSLTSSGDIYYEITKHRRRGGIDEIIQNNFDKEHSIFVTLTFDEKRLGKANVTNLDWTHKEFAKFIKRIGYRYDNFGYIATFSRQKIGNWHYHMICNLPPETTEREIRDLWRNGRVDKSTYQSTMHYENVKKYLIKNMEAIENELRGRKGYLSSLNAKRNIHIRSWRDEDKDKYDVESRKIVERGVESVTMVSNSEEWVGVMLDTRDGATGEVYKKLLPYRELTEGLIKLGGVECFKKTEVYFSKGSNEDIFPAPQFAVLKSPKPKTKKKK